MAVGTDVVADQILRIFCENSKCAEAAVQRLLLVMLTTFDDASWLKLCKA